MTVLDHLLSVFRNAAIYNRHDLAKPNVILWTDGDRHWEKVSGLIAAARPGFFLLDPSETGPFYGPSTWIRYQLGKWSGDEVPVIYLPGIHRHQFRGFAGFPEEAKHLYALQFQGQFCSQINGKDWTPTAFLAAGDQGLGLQLARDRATQEALSEQLSAVLQTPVAGLKGKHLEASDFHELAVGDPVRLLLDWMSDPAKSESRPSGQRAALANYSKKELGFDPEKDGLITAAEKLVAAEGKWQSVWKRFEEAAVTFPGVRKALDLVQPADLFSNSNPRIPATNRRLEDDLRKGLMGLSNLTVPAARSALAKLAEDHAPRCGSVWATLDEAPLAVASAHLGTMLAVIGSGVSGIDYEEMGSSYLAEGWRVDSEARKAWASARKADDTAAVTAALKAVYQPWLEDLAIRLQGCAGTYPVSGPLRSPVHQPEPGTVMLFVDGLRADIGQELVASLDVATEITLTKAWSALPTVTATAKPAWLPLSNHLDGQIASEGYEPTMKATGKLCRTNEFRKLTTEAGWTWFETTLAGDPSGCGYTEVGAFDRYGHEQGAKLAWRVAEEVAAIRQRVTELMDAGWKRVRIITDHGWLWMPGGLPKIDLPTHLTVSKWGRCARPELQASHGLPQVSWFWANELPIVLAPGIGVFKSGTEYAHGGLTLQEALTLQIEISAGETTGQPVKIKSAKWMGMRLRVELDSADTTLRADIRSKPTDVASSKLGSESGHLDKGPDADGRLTLLLDDDSYLGEAAVLVVLRDGQVIAKQIITVGED